MVNRDFKFIVFFFSYFLHFDLISSLKICSVYKLGKNIKCLQGVQKKTFCGFLGMTK